MLALANIGAGPPHLLSGHTRPLTLSPAQAQSLVSQKVGPSVAARASALADAPTGAVLWGQAADEPLPMASVTKLMTVLVALQTLSLDQVLTVPPEALVGEASMGLSAGERISVEALLYGALLPSGNDAAMTLALAAAGDEASFVQRMNEQAAAWGLTHTHFVNPTGFDAPGHVSSAGDLIALGRQALANPVIAGISAQPEATVSGYHLINTNELLTSYPGAYGLKTGTSDEAGQVLMGAAHRRGGNAIAVVLNSPDRYADMPRLLDFYFDHWRDVRFRLDRNTLNRITGPDGAHYILQATGEPMALPVWETAQTRGYRRINFDAANQPSGVYQLWLGDQLLAETPLTFHRE